LRRPIETTAQTGQVKNYFKCPGLSQWGDTLTTISEAAKQIS
jgi:hypothetical protein